MLAARAEQMKMAVVKAESTFDMWSEYPFVFRVVLAPIFVLAILYYSLDAQQAELVVLGDEGEEVDLQNGDLLVSEEDPDHVEARAFAADAVYSLGAETDGPAHLLYSVLMALQSVVWCLLGTPVSLVLFGNYGGRVPDWAWEPEEQGPHLQSVRITPLGG